MSCKKLVLCSVLLILISLLSCELKSPTHPALIETSGGTTYHDGQAALIFHESGYVIVVNVKNENNQPLYNIDIEGYLKDSKYLIIVYDRSDNYFPNIKIDRFTSKKAIELDIVLKAMATPYTDLTDAIIELEANRDELLEFMDPRSPHCYDEEELLFIYELQIKTYDFLVVYTSVFNNMPGLYAVVSRLFSASMDKDFIHCFFKEGNAYKNFIIIWGVSIVFIQNFELLCEPGIYRFEANPSNIKKGESSTLRWSTDNATEVYIEPEIGRVEKEGSITVSPVETTTYTLRAKNLTKEQSTSVTITVT